MKTTLFLLSLALSTILTLSCDQSIALQQLWSHGKRFQAFDPEAISKSLVSVGHYDDEGVYQHLAGGFIVHRGVVLTSLREVWDHHRHLYGISAEVFEKELYVAPFDYDAPESSAPTKVQTWQSHKTLGSLSSPTISNLTLLFLPPSSPLAEMPPLPLATTVDLGDLSELQGQPLWTVGVRDKAGIDPKRPCSGQKRSALGELRLTHMPEEYGWMRMLIKAFPGRLKDSIHYILLQNHKVAFSTQSVIILP